MFQYCLDCVNPESILSYSSAVVESGKNVGDSGICNRMQYMDVCCVTVRVFRMQPRLRSGPQKLQPIASLEPKPFRLSSWSNDISGSEETTYGRCTGKIPASLLARNTACQTTTGQILVGEHYHMVECIITPMRFGYTSAVITTKNGTKRSLLKSCLR